jgi:hypothetical protein
MAEHELVFEATPELGSHALRCLLKKRGGKGGVAALVALPILLAVLAPGSPVAAGMIGGAALMLLGLFLLAVQIRRRAARRFLSTAADRRVRVALSDAGISVTSALGEGTIGWGGVRAVWACDRVVLFIQESWSYVAVPREAATEEAIRFAQERVAALGSPPGRQRF